MLRTHSISAAWRNLKHWHNREDIQMIFKWSIVSLVSVSWVWPGYDIGTPVTIRIQSAVWCLPERREKTLRVSELFGSFLHWHPESKYMGFLKIAKHNQAPWLGHMHDARPAHWKNSNFGQCVVIRWVCVDMRYSFVERARPTLCIRCHALCALEF